MSEQNNVESIIEKVGADNFYKDPFKYLVESGIKERDLFGDFSEEIGDQRDSIEKAPGATSFASPKELPYVSGKKTGSKLKPWTWALEISLNHKACQDISEGQVEELVKVLALVPVVGTALAPVIGAGLKLTTARIKDLDKGNGVHTSFPWATIIVGPMPAAVAGIAILRMGSN